MINKDLVSVHVFLYYEDVGIELLEKIKEIYNGHIYLSLVKNNSSNKALIKHSQQLFDTHITYVDNGGNDQYGFFHTFKEEKEKKLWTLYVHDKHSNKKQWLFELLEPFKKVNKDLLNNKSIGIISSIKHKNKVEPMNVILQKNGSIEFQYRKNIVQNLHTIIWLKELQRILLEKYELINEENIHPTFCSGNVFLAKTDVIEKAQGCVYEDFFNVNAYRTDGEVGHGLERFYFYVSKCLNYNNLFI